MRTDPNVGIRLIDSHELSVRNPIGTTQMKWSQNDSNSLEKLRKSVPRRWIGTADRNHSVHGLLIGLYWRQSSKAPERASGRAGVAASELAPAASGPLASDVQTSNAFDVDGLDLGQLDLLQVEAVTKKKKS